MNAGRIIARRHIGHDQLSVIGSNAHKIEPGAIRSLKNRGDIPGRKIKRLNAEDQGISSLHRADVNQRPAELQIIPGNWHAPAGQRWIPNPVMRSGDRRRSHKAGTGWLWSQRDGGGLGKSDGTTTQDQTRGHNPNSRENSVHKKPFPCDAWQIEKLLHPIHGAGYAADVINNLGQAGAVRLHDKDPIGAVTGDIFSIR